MTRRYVVQAVVITTTEKDTRVGRLAKVDLYFDFEPTVGQIIRKLETKIGFYPLADNQELAILSAIEDIH